MLGQGEEGLDLTCHVGVCYVSSVAAARCGSTRLSFKYPAVPDILFLQQAHHFIFLLSLV